MLTRHQSIWHAYFGKLQWRAVTWIIENRLKEIPPSVVLHTEGKHQAKYSRDLCFIKEPDKETVIVSVPLAFDYGLLTKSVTMVLDEMKHNGEHGAYAQAYFNVGNDNALVHMDSVGLLSFAFNNHPLKKVVNVYPIFFPNFLATTSTLQSFESRTLLTFRILSVVQTNPDSAHFIHCVRLFDGGQWKGVPLTIAVNLSDHKAIVSGLKEDAIIWATGTLYLQMDEKDLGSMKNLIPFTGKSTYKFVSSKGIFRIADYILPYNIDHPYTGMKHICHFLKVRDHDTNYVCGCSFIMRPQEKHVFWHNSESVVTDFLSIKERFVLRRVSKKWKEKVVSTSNFKKACLDFISRSFSSYDFDLYMSCRPSEAAQLITDIKCNDYLFRWVRRITLILKHRPFSTIEGVKAIIQEKICSRPTLSAWGFTSKQWEQIPGVPRWCNAFWFESDLPLFRKLLPVKIVRKVLNKGQIEVFNSAPPLLRDFIELREGKGKKGAGKWFLVKKPKIEGQPKRKKRRIC